MELYDSDDDGIIGANKPEENSSQPKPFLGVFYMSCNVYGRLYKNKENTFYEGHCPRCGTVCKVPIGAQGTSVRFFRAICR
jgi:hypothetical protein